MQAILTNIPEESVSGRIFRDKGEAFKAKHSRKTHQSESDLSKLAALLLDFHTDLKSLIYIYPKNGKPEFRKGLSVNKTWLKNWHKEIFYSWIKKDNNRQGKYVFKDLVILHTEFKRRIDDWKKYSSAIKEASESPPESQFRRSDIAGYIRGLLARRQWNYINDFLTEAHDTNRGDLDKKIGLLKDALKKLQDKLKTEEQHCLPSQSSGVETAKASFNYYTVNKESKEYYEGEFQKAKDKLCKETFSTIRKTEKGKYQWAINKNFHNRTNQQAILFQFKSEQEREWIKRYVRKQKCEKDNNKDKFEGDLEQGASLSLNQTYAAMKIFKAEQKSILYEVVVHIASEKKNNSSYQVKNENLILKNYEISYQKLNKEGLSQEFSLFEFKDEKYKKNGQNIHIKSEDKYNKFVELTENIQREKNSEKQKQSAKERGQFLFGKNCYFGEYGRFCEEYKKIAQKRGRLIAQIKGLEREKQEAMQTDFWGMIYCDQDKKQLWLVSKENRQGAKKFIYNKRGRQNYTPGDLQYLCCFKSLTMRALHKLCFAEQSSFVKDGEDGMPEDLRSLQKEAEQFKTEGDAEKFKEKDQKKLKFFKKLLKSDYAKKKLPVLEAFEPAVINTLHPVKGDAWRAIGQSESLEEFEKSLETACYYVKRIVFREGEKDHFLKNFDVTVLDVSSYDLEGRNRNAHPWVSENRYHTDLWQTFWDNMDKLDERAEVRGFSVGPVRLNPEVKIRYRTADEKLKKYFGKRGFPSKFKHRRLRDQLTVHFTLALNAGKRYEDLAFAKPEELSDKINSFNKTLNRKRNFKTVWKYGIDRGQVELATLCLVRFNQNQGTYQINGKAVPEPEFADIPCYTFEKYDYEEEYITKKGETRKRQAIKNLSYFVNEKYLNDKQFFSEEETSCLDLTVAKVIREKIITNGDVMTFLKLKKAVAKRRLYELYHVGEITRSAKLDWSEWEDGEEKEDKHRPEGVLNIETSNGEKTVYWYCKKYENISLDLKKDIKYDQGSIKNSLNHYLEELRKKERDSYLNQSEEKRYKEDHTPSILQINHLRDALAANMVGVIYHLQKTHPGFIMLENLVKGIIDRHFFNHNENISRRLENALYNKFQSLGLIPPHVKDIISLREKMRNKQQSSKMEKSKQNHSNKHIESSSQIGAVFFVNPENTSQNCPYCEAKQNRKHWRKEKLIQKRFICDSCGFDTYYFKTEKERVANYKPEVNNENKKKFELFKDINDPDKVAAYNIAKKIKSSEEIGKTEL